MGEPLHDLRYGARLLVKNRGFTVVAVLTLALGIGANTAIFSVVNAVLLRPLPYPRPNQIVQVSLAWKGGGLNDALTAPEFEFYRDHTRTFETMAGFRGSAAAAIRQNQETEWIAPLRVTDGFFEVLGVRPAIGRGILRGETQSDGARVAVLSDSLWAGHSVRTPRSSAATSKWMVRLTPWWESCHPGSLSSSSLPTCSFRWN